MATVGATKLILTLCIIVVFLICVLEEVDGRRGGGGRGGSRGGSRGRNRGKSYGSGRSSRGYGGSSGTSYRSYRNVVLRGRIIGGSSHFTSRTWRTAAIAGAIYGGARYARLHPHRREKPPICTNNYAYLSDGRKYGYFICPRLNETSLDIYCCGPKHREYCCNVTMAKIYYGSRQNSSSGKLGVGAILGILLAVAVVIAIIFVCCKKRKSTGEVIRKFSSKRATQRPSHQPQPQEPPPSYGESVGYSAGPELPYSLHPGQDANGGIDGTKPGPPPGGDIVMYPEPFHPSSEVQPYPPQPSAPYPMSDGVPYPPPSNMSPYPPPGGDGPMPPQPLPYPPSGMPPQPVPYPPSYDGSGVTPYPPQPHNQHSVV